MENKDLATLDAFQYGLSLGLADGEAARDQAEKGNPVDFGDLLSANDPYALGFRKGINRNGDPRKEIKDDAD